MKQFFLFLCISIIPVQCSHAGIRLLDGLTHAMKLSTGEVYQGELVLKNTGDDPCEVKAYQSDYMFYADGTNEYAEPGTTHRSNAEWISIVPTYLTIEPHDIGVFHYTITVPDTPDLKGTYWSMVMIEPVPDGKAYQVSSANGRARIGLRFVTRYAVQIVTNMVDPGECAVEFIDRRIVYRDGSTFFQLDMENTGEQWLVPHIWMELYDEEGGYMGSFGDLQFRLYPGCSLRQSIDIGDVSPGRYKALVIIDNGDETVFGGKYDLEIAD